MTCNGVLTPQQKYTPKKLNPPPSPKIFYSPLPSPIKLSNLPPIGDKKHKNPMSNVSSNYHLSKINLNVDLHYSNLLIK